VLCLVTLVSGVAALRRAPAETATAITSGSPEMAMEPPAVEQDAAVADAISLPDLVRRLRASTTTSVPRATSTPTTRKSPATTLPPPATTTTTTARPTSAAPATTSSTTPLTPLTTLIDAVVPPAVAVAGAITRTDSGVASWFNAPDGTCAHRTLPMGTVVKITRPENDASTTCRVNDRGPAAGTGRLIDLSLDTFQKLASKDAGLIEVNIAW